MTTRPDRRRGAANHTAGVIGICVVTLALVLAVVALGIAPVLL